MVYPPIHGERDGMTWETALYADSDDEDGEEGELEENDFPLMDVKPDVEAIEEPRTAWKVFKVKGPGARMYLQPDVEIVPDIRTTVIGKKAIGLLESSVAAGTDCVEVLRVKSKLLKLLKDAATCWGLVKEITPGRDGGCHGSLKKGYECIVRSLSVKDTSAQSGLSQRVIGRCLACCISPTAPGCDIVMNNNGKQTSAQLSTDSETTSIPSASANTSISGSSKNPKNGTPSTAFDRRIPEGDGESLGPTSSRVTQIIGGTMLSSRAAQGLKRKVPPNDLASSSARQKRSRNNDFDVDGATASSLQATVSTPASAAVHTGNAALVDTADSRDVGSSIVGRELSLEAIRQVRDQAKSVELEIVGRSPGGLDGKTSSLFTMMARGLDIIERAVTSTPHAPPVGRVEALKAINFLPKFAAESRKLIVGDTEDSLDFLFENMFELMEIHAETLREAANKL